MKLKLFRFYPLLFFIFASCAIQVAPDGGMKDTEPPKVSKETPPNYSTGFVGHEFSITFDEYIQLNDLPGQLIVSPPLKHAPIAKLNKKTLRVELEDTLAENTTYTFNFGNAISDNRENNVLQDFQYVFSTGPILDSLSISGIVTKATDLKEVKKVLVMLYRDSDDSIPYKSSPDYFSKTDEEGKFKIRNISPASYRLFALEESNGNYLYESIEENIGFSDSVVTAPAEGISIRLFKERPPMQLIKSYSVDPGLINIIFSGAADTLPIQWIGDSSLLQIFAKEYSFNKDTLSIWYKNLLADSIHLFFPSLPGNDTVYSKLATNEPKIISKRKFNFQVTPVVSSGTIQDLHQPLLLKFNHPVMNEDFEKIQIKNDSVVLTNVKYVYKDRLHTILQINPTWQEESRYSVFVPPGAFTDIHGLTNDSLLFNFTTRNQADYGSVAIHFHGDSAVGPFLLNLIDEKDNVYAEAFVKSKTDTLISFNNLNPLTYRLKVIFDSNNNRRWDTGNYLNHIQPEKVEFYPETIVVRANWDVDIKWTPVMK